MERMMFGIISRRTIIWLLLLAASWGFLAYRSWHEGRSCREWMRANHGMSLPPPVQQPDGTYTVSFSPCDLWQSMPLIDELAALFAVITAVGFLSSLVKDIIHWMRLRRAARNSEST